jgi:hypothetical protein
MKNFKCTSLLISLIASATCFHAEGTEVSAGPKNFPTYFENTKTFAHYEGVTRLGEFGVSRCRVEFTENSKNPHVTRMTFFYSIYPQSYEVSTQWLADALTERMGEEIHIQFDAPSLWGDDRRPATIVLKRAPQGELLEVEIQTAKFKDELKRAHEQFNPAGVYPTPYRCLKLNRSEKDQWM